ncbi:MAG: hypothetical protein K2X29_07870 [Candidatus Obscuribacterales bacterium]|nr:hypothetical protein [Candidatus Obscuribacterales bacterium]
MRRRNYRGAKGHLMFELPFASFFMILIALITANLSLILWGINFNDRACRDAARSAAQGSDYETALKLAKAALKAHRADGFMIEQPQISVGDFVYEDFGGTAPADISPYVRVKTTTRVRIPAPILLLGLAPASNGFMDSTCIYSFPIVKFKLRLS